jgi:peptide/nickel transport system substrate-binding protein
VVVTLQESRPDLLIELADPGLGISNVTYVESMGQDAGFNPVGSGPFKFKEWVQGSRIVLERNPDWTWGSSLFNTTGPAYLDELVFRFIPEAQTRLATLETGESDFIDLLPFADIQRMKDDSRYTVTQFLLPGMPQMNYLNTSVVPTNELAVRQAIIYATDKQSIIDVVYFGLTEPA